MHLNNKMKQLIERYKKLKPDFDVESCSKLEDVRDVVRLNTLKMSEEEIIKRLEKIKVKLNKIDFLPHSYKYKSKFSLASTTEYCNGFIYLQEAASQIPVLILDPKENESILDMCAAPGSKTTYISQLINNKGVIIATDSSSGRLKGLKSNLNRCGCKNVIIYKKDARFIFDLNKKFDKILLDAPCSGNCVIEPDFFQKKDVYGFKERANLQKELLKAAYKVLKEKGVLIYSTCSSEPEENELVMDWFLNKFEDMQLEKINLKIPNADKGLTNVFDKELNSEISKCIRIWPDSGMQSFFIAKLVKK